MAAGIEYLVQHTTTVDVPASQRPDYWREHVRSNHGGLDMSYPSPGAFDGGTIVQRCGQYQLVEFWSDGITYHRSARDARSDDDRSLRMVVPRHGQLDVAQGGRVTRLTHGRAAVVTMAAPFELAQLGRARALVLSVPEGSLPGTRAATIPVDLDLRSGIGSVAAAMADSLARERDSLSAVDFLAVSTRLLEIVGTAQARENDDRLGSIAHRARLYVAEHSDDPAVTPQTMARELGWSLRQLQLALHTAGTTPAGMLRDQRLDRARSRLQDPGCARLPISEIAFGSGFTSLSAFGAAFRSRYGNTPRALRAHTPSRTLGA
ncbi:AraC family transcriptional regulator [Rhodococcus spelaei]|uniref:AraC family transcriptional regulator n=1 Tax=Rhodococcus spelaei TaxID=2546320 RepID=A0A541B8D1_9NOCA|nr:AraC family transcriptional regulator [Rhodococcus spelaei]TQF68579.1 AraC family transcriptional regulator [Rhodococcus spelaei]